MDAVINFFIEWCRNLLIVDISKFIWALLSTGFTALLSIVATYFSREHRDLQQTLKSEGKKAIGGVLFLGILSWILLSLVLPPEITGHTLSTQQGTSVPIVRPPQVAPIFGIPQIILQGQTVRPSPTPPPQPCYEDGPFYFKRPPNGEIYSTANPIDVEVLLRRGWYPQYVEYEIFYTTNLKFGQWEPCKDTRKPIPCGFDADCTLTATFIPPAPGTYWLLPKLIKGNSNFLPLEEVQECAVKIIIE